VDLFEKIWAHKTSNSTAIVLTEVHVPSQEKE
jgi:hypothetical protein